MDEINGYRCLCPPDRTGPHCQDSMSLQDDENKHEYVKGEFPTFISLFPPTQKQESIAPVTAMLPWMEPAGKKTATFVIAPMERWCAQRYALIDTVVDAFISTFLC